MYYLWYKHHRDEYCTRKTNVFHNHLKCFLFKPNYISTNNNKMEDKFIKILELIDKNSNVIPDGDYLEMCNLLRDIRASRVQHIESDDDITRNDLLLINQELINVIQRQNNFMRQVNMSQRNTDYRNRIMDLLNIRVVP